MKYIIILLLIIGVSSSFSQSEIPIDSTFDSIRTYYNPDSTLKFELSWFDCVEACFDMKIYFLDEFIGDYSVDPYSNDTITYPIIIPMTPQYSMVCAVDVGVNYMESIHWMIWICDPVIPRFMGRSIETTNSYNLKGQPLGIRPEYYMDVSRETRTY